MYKPVRNQYLKKNKHQCVMMDQNIFMKQIGSIVLILNHTGFFLGHFYIFVAFWSFFIICENLDFAVLSKQFFYRINNFL